MQAVGYIRISTTLKRQDDQALETQADKIREACLSTGFDLTHIYEDVGPRQAHCPALGSWRTAWQASAPMRHQRCDSRAAIRSPRYCTALTRGMVIAITITPVSKR